MEYHTEDIVQALKELSDKFPDNRVNNNKSVGSSDNKTPIKKMEYVRTSMKRSNFKNVTYQTCKFLNVALTGSAFYSVGYIDCEIKGDSFVCCNFYDSSFINNTKNIFTGSNYSQSNFTRCTFANVIFESSSFLQTLFHKSLFRQTRFQGTTLEGAKFSGCTLEDVDMGGVNVEFIELLNTSLNNVIFPFYQFAYIIGAADYINSATDTVRFSTGEKEILMSEFVDQLDHLILYYYDKTDYFPMCNLLIAKGNSERAKETLLDGINISLHDMDFRMIRHFCRLAQRHNLLDEFTIQRIIRKIENYLIEGDVPSECLNDCLIHFGEIRSILLSGNSNMVNLCLKIRTNVCKKNQDGVSYVNSLCNGLNDALSQNDWGQGGFQIAISNHSPFEIIIDVVCLAASLVTVADFVWKIIDRYKSNDTSNQSLTEFEQQDTAIYQKYIDTRIDLYKEQILNIKSKYSKKEFNHYIEEITQQLKTDIDSLCDKDIVIFKKKNKGKED